MTAPLGDRIRSSVKITFAATLVTGLIQACTMVVLARLLGPSDYGFYIVCLSINALSVSFLSTALERAMIIEPDEDVLLGRAIPLVLLLGSAALLAEAICALVRHLAAWGIDLRVLAIVLAAQTASGIAIVPRALLRRRLAFGRIVAGELIALVTGNLVTAAVLAHAGFGAFSLAFGFLVAQLISTASILLKEHAGLLRIRIRGLSSLARTALGVLKVASLEAVNGQITPIIVTAALGAASLGLFNRVYSLVTLPIQLLVSSMNRVMISALVAVANEAERRQRAVNMLLRCVAAMITPLALGVAGSSHAFVAVVLGPKWLAAAPIIPFLAIAVWGNMIGSVLGQVAESVQRFNDKAWIQGASTIILIVSLLIGGHWGLPGVAVGAMVAALLFAGFYLRLTSSIMGVSIFVLIRWLAPGWVAGAACFAAAQAVADVLAGAAQSTVFAAQIGACAIVAPLTLLLLERKLIVEMSSLILPVRIDAVVRSVLGGGARQRPQPMPVSGSWPEN